MAEDGRGLYDAAISVLVDELEVAHQRFSEDRLAGEAEALASVLRFLHSIGTDAKLRRPIYEIWGRQKDAQDSSSNQKPIKEALDMAVASVAITLLMEDGSSLDAAAKKVAREMGRDGSGRAFKNFRNNLLSYKVRKEATDFYHDILSNALPDRPAKQRADVILLKLRRLTREKT